MHTEKAPGFGARGFPTFREVSNVAISSTALCATDRLDSYNPFHRLVYEQMNYFLTFLAGYLTYPIIRHLWLYNGR